MKETELSKAMSVLIKDLKEDEMYREVWISNIAMSFYNQCLAKQPKTINEFHDVANMAAKDFLNMLCQENQRYYEEHEAVYYCEKCRGILCGCNLEYTVSNNTVVPIKKADK